MKQTAGDPFSLLKIKEAKDPALLTDEKNTQGFLQLHTGGLVPAITFSEHFCSTTLHLSQLPYGSMGWWSFHKHVSEVTR